MIADSITHCIGGAPGLMSCFSGGRSSEVERQLPKLNVVGSTPIARSNFPHRDCRVSGFALPARIPVCGVLFQ